MIVTISTTSYTSSCSRSFKQRMSQGGKPIRMSEDVKDFRQVFLDMAEMVKILYEERNTKLKGESSNKVTRMVINHHLLQNLHGFLQLLCNMLV